MHYAYSKFIGKPGYFVDKLNEALQGYIKTWVTLKIIQLSFNTLMQSFDGKRTRNTVDIKRVIQDAAEIQSKYTVHEVKDDAARIVEALDMQSEALRIDKILGSHYGCISSSIDICATNNNPIDADLRSWLSINNTVDNDENFYIYRSIDGIDQLVAAHDIQIFLRSINDGPQGIYKDFLTTPFLKDVHSALTITMPKRLWLRDASSSLYAINHDIVTQCLQFVTMVDDIVHRKTATAAYSKAERNIVPLFESITHDCQKALDMYKSRIMTYRRMAYLP